MNLMGRIAVELLADIFETVPDEDLIRYDTGHAYPDYYWNSWPV